MISSTVIEVIITKVIAKGYPPDLKWHVSEGIDNGNLHIFVTKSRPNRLSVYGHHVMSASAREIESAALLARYLELNCQEMYDTMCQQLEFLEFYERFS